MAGMQKLTDAPLHKNFAGKRSARGRWTIARIKANFPPRRCCTISHQHKLALLKIIRAFLRPFAAKKFYFPICALLRKSAARVPAQITNLS
jgi:hypothetical protein